MRLPCSIACLAACTFSPPGAPIDAGADAAAREWVVVDELTVPSSGAQVTSSFVLQAGVGYRLRASGTYYIALQTLGDAEYYRFNLGDPLDGVSGIDVGLAVNDATVDASRTPRWGPYDASHVYEVAWTGDGAAITAQLHDGNYTNNAGALTLEVLDLR